MCGVKPTIATGCAWRRPCAPKCKPTMQLPAAGGPMAHTAPRPASVAMYGGRLTLVGGVSQGGEGDLSHRHLVKCEQNGRMVAGRS